MDKFWRHGLSHLDYKNPPFEKKLTAGRQIVARSLFDCLRQRGNTAD